MAVSGQNTAEGIPLATAPTSGNSGGTSGTAITTINVGVASSILVQSSALIHGTRGFAFTLAGNTADGATRLMWSMGGSGETTRLVLSFYLNITSTVTAFEDLAGFRHVSYNKCLLSIGADGKMIMSDWSGASVAASKAPNVFPTGIVRVEVAHASESTTGANDGKMGYAYFLGNDTTPVYSWESSAMSTASTSATDIFIGRSTGRAGARVLNYDTVRWATMSGWMDPYVDPGASSGTITQIGINTAEGIPVGTTLTSTSTTITGGASGTAASTINVGVASQILVSNFNTAHGSRGFYFDLAGSTSDGATRLMFPCVRSDRTVFSFYVGELTALPGALEDLGGIRNSSGNIAILSIGADGKLILSDAGGSISASRATNTFPIQTKVRVDISVRKGTTSADGLVGYAYFLGDSDTPVFTWEASNRNTGTTDTGTVFIGRSTGRANATDLYIDTVRWGYGTGWFQHYIPPKTAPYADLGGDKNDIEPYSQVTINASNSFDTDGTITLYTLTQMSGPTVDAVTGSGPIFTYKAPGDIAASAVVWQLVVKDNDNLTSAPVSATHNILPVNEMAVIGGVLVPIEWSAVTP